MTFWGTDLGGAATGEPKRKYKFKIQIGDLAGGTLWYAKTVDKPEITVSNSTEHKYLGHTFKFPGVATWNAINIALVDPITENASRKLLQKLRESGYVFPDNPNVVETISKNKSVDAVGVVVITQIDSDGNMVEKWTLHNPFFSKVGFGDLSYEDEGLSEIALEVTYDWATYEDSAGDEIFKAIT